MAVLQHAEVGSVAVADGAEKKVKDAVFGEDDGFDGLALEVVFLQVGGVAIRGKDEDVEVGMGFEGTGGSAPCEEGHVDAREMCLEKIVGNGGGMCQRLHYRNSLEGVEVGLCPMGKYTVKRLVMR